jgi:cytochrome c-type biogenesis protein
VVRARIVRDTALFVAGFSAVFVLLGLSVTSLGNALFRNQDLLTRVSGGLVVAMGVFLLATQMVFRPWLQQERRFHPKLERLGPLAAPVAGAAFGFGWTPCIGPVLASVLAVASSRANVGEGGALLAVYSLGLGVPFLLTGLAFGKLTGGFDWLIRHVRSVNIGAAALMVAFGLLLVSGKFTVVTADLRNVLDAVGLGQLIDLG